MSIKVAVLGSRLSGLLAAHAAMVVTQGEAHVDIVDTNERTEIRGAQYLHEPIPYITRGYPQVVDYRLQGTVDGYRAKVYGPESTEAVSPESLVGQHPAWDMRQAYDLLWRTYGMAALSLGSRTVQQFLHEVLESSAYDVVFSSVDLSTLCIAGHRFTSAKIWVGEYYFGPPTGQGVSRIVCNGNREPAWYRTSRVFGHSQTEWPEAAKPPVPVVALTKPVSNTCSCWPEVVRVGRHGEWRKGVLAHHAYKKAKQACEQAVRNARS